MPMSRSPVAATAAPIGSSRRSAPTGEATTMTAVDRSVRASAVFDQKRRRSTDQERSTSRSVRTISTGPTSARSTRAPSSGPSTRSIAARARAREAAARSAGEDLDVEGNHRLTHDEHVVGGGSEFSGQARRLARGEHLIDRRAKGGRADLGDLGFLHQPIDDLIGDRLADGRQVNEFLRESGGRLSGTRDTEQHSRQDEREKGNGSDKRGDRDDQSAHDHGATVSA